MPSKFGLNGTEKPAPLIRYGDPRSKLYTTIDWRESSNANKTLITNFLRNKQDNKKEKIVHKKKYF